MPAWSREIAAALLAAAWAGAPAAALGGEPSDIAGVDLEGLLDHRLAAESLREEGASAAAASVFVLEGEDLRRQGFATVADALASVPGLFAYRDGFYSYVGVRGVGMLGDFTTRLLVLVDGHPVNDSVAIGASHLGRDLPVVLDAVKRIEVVKGPVGGVYGATAFLGVVNVVTQDARLASAELRATGEAAQRRALGGGSSAVATVIAGDFEVLLAADAASSRGLDWSFPELGQGSDRPPVPAGHVDGMAAWDALSAQARIERGGLRLAAACNRAATGLPAAPYASTLLDRRNAIANRSCFADAALARGLAPGLTVVGRAAYDWFDFRDTYGYPEPPAGVGLVHDLGTDRWWSGELRVEWEPSGGRRLVAGARAERHETVQRTWSHAGLTLLQDPVNGVGVGDIRRDFAGGTAFLLAEQALPGGVTLHGDFALTLHEMYGARLTPKLAAVWRPGAATAVKLVAAEGFRPPLASEAFFEDGLSFLPNPSLRPELARSLEASMERRVGRFATLSASLFRNEYRDLVRFATVPAPGLGHAPDPSAPGDWRQMPMNLERAEVRGGELSLDVRWCQALRAWGGVSVQQARGDSPLENFPTATASLAASARLGSALVVAARAAFVSSRAKPPAGLDPGARAAVPASAVVDAAATLELSRGLSLQVGVSNLLDAAAPSPMPADFKPITEQPAPARTFVASLRWSARP